MVGTYGYTKIHIPLLFARDGTHRSKHEMASPWTATCQKWLGCFCHVSLVYAKLNGLTRAV